MQPGRPAVCLPSFPSRRSPASSSGPHDAPKSDAPVLGEEIPVAPDGLGVAGVGAVGLEVPRRPGKIVGGFAAEYIQGEIKKGLKVADSAAVKADAVKRCETGIASLKF